MRWQWSHARLTLRLTGAEALRSSFGVSAVEVSMAAGGRRSEVGRDGGSQRTGAVMGYFWIHEWAGEHTIEDRGTRTELRTLGRMG